jgi:hypothetical protein
VFYCLQPRGKEACKFLKKLLGLKEKKRRLRLPFKKAAYKLESQRGRNNCIFKVNICWSWQDIYWYLVLVGPSRVFNLSLSRKLPWKSRYHT